MTNKSLSQTHQPAEVAGAILDHLQSQQRMMVDFLSELVLAESPTTDRVSQAAVQKQLIEALRLTGFQTEMIPGRRFGDALLARPAAQSPVRGRQLLLGHCDTVWPVGTLHDMPLLREGNTLRGPGVYDMKAGLTHIIFSLQTVRELGLQPGLEPVVLINADEEIGSPESTPLIEEQAALCQRVFVLEPSLGTSGKIKTARKGVGTFTATIHGRAAHAGLDPEKGVSAILELSHIVQKLHALNDKDNGVSVNVGRIEGGLRSNVVPPSSMAEIDVRVRTGADARRIERAIRGLKPRTAGTTLLIEGAVNRPPLERTSANQKLWRKAVALGALLGLDLAQGAAGGASDGNTTSQFSPTLDGLGAVGDGAHAEHEFIFVDRMIERCALLTLLILEP